MIKRKSDAKAPISGGSPKEPLRYQAVESYILNFIRENNL